MTERVQLMLFDLVRELVDMAKATKIEATRTGADFDKGRQFAFYEVVSLLTQYADVFGVERAEVGLEGIDPDNDLLF